MTGFFDEGHDKECTEPGQATLDVEQDLGPNYFSNQVRNARRIREDCYVIDQSDQTRNSVVRYLRQVEGLHWLLENASSYC
jgi:hypothetical protein